MDKSHSRYVKQVVCDTMALPFTLKSILRQKKDYGKTQIFHHAKNINLQKIPRKESKKSFKILETV